jgi:hypothetical protein
MQFSYPLSGDVMQEWVQPMVNAWTQQNGIININTMNSGDSKAESEIVERVASYGRQLGWLLEAVDVLIHKLEKSECLGDLTEEEDLKLEQIKTLKQRIDDAKERRGG